MDNHLIQSYNESGEGIPFFQGNADFGDRYPVVLFGE